MAITSIDRETRILEYLKNNGSASIQQLVEAFGVSNMTIHRDLNKLADAGLILKKHGGAILSGNSRVTEDREGGCAMCGKTLSTRSLFIIKLENGEERRACCGHCGLMLHSHADAAWKSMTTDYLYGHMVSATQAVYLMGSEVSICCVPSILSFGSRQDAEKFQKGFGGVLVSLDQALNQLQGMMHSHD